MFYKHNKQQNNHDGVVQPEQDQTVNPPQSVGPPLNAYRANEHLPKHVFDALAPKSLWLLMAEYIEYYATPREQFIFAVMTGATSIRYDEDHRHVLNYPGKSVTRQTFITHKRHLMNVFRGLSLKATNAPVTMVKA